jgi:predicted transcriptional regulator
MGDLYRAVRRLMSEGQEKTKAATKDFNQFLEDMFTSCKARCKTAKARGDASAPDEVKLRQAIDAFYAQLK